MTTDEIKALYVEHKQYFMDVLGSSATADGAIAIIGDELVEIEHTEGRWFSYVPGDGIRPLNASLAVAAMTEAWRERLEKDAQIRRLRLDRGMWECNVGREPRHIELLYPSLPELICAAVEILVAEKREKAKAPSDVATRAASRIAPCHKIMAGKINVSADDWQSIIAAIIDEELKKG